MSINYLILSVFISVGFCSINTYANILNSTINTELQDPIYVEALYYLKQAHDNPLYKNKGLQLLEQSAMTGERKAQLEMYFLYKNGTFVETDEKLAQKWLNKAIASYHPDAIAIQLSQLYIKKPYEEEKIEQLLTILQDMANQNSSKAMRILSDYYLNHLEQQDIAQGIAWLKKAANLQDSEAQYFMGTYYFKGQYLPHNNKKGLEWMLRAAENGNGVAQNQLGLLYVKGQADLPVDFEKARYWFEKSADSSYTGGMRNIGIAYLRGELGYSKDQVQAIAWLSDAALKGHVNAQLDLAELYMKGTLTPVDPEKELAWRLVADKNFNTNDIIKHEDKASEIFLDSVRYDASYANGFNKLRISQLYRDNRSLGETDRKSLAFEWVEKSAQLNFTWAQLYLAQLYEQGQGTVKNYKLAFEWVEKAAKNHDATAMSLLGWYYMQGIGTAKRPQQAHKWWSKVEHTKDISALLLLGYYYQELQQWSKLFQVMEILANLGDAEAGLRLSEMYRRGQGVEKNETQYLFWLEKLAKQNNKVAQYNLATYYIQEATRNDKLATYWYEKAANQGYALAQNNLGFFYLEGRYYPQSCDMALHFFTQAAEQNELLALENLENFYTQGKCIVPDIEKAQYWQNKIKQIKVKS